MNAPNPKKAFGDKKPSLHLVPLSGMIAQWEAQFDGYLKYTEVNWRKDPVEAMTYIDAILRHTRLYENGEELARDTKVKNLGAVMACCAILIDAELHGTLIDNRTHSPQTCDLLHGRGEEMVKHLRAAQADRDAAKEAAKIEQGRVDASWASAAVEDTDPDPRCVVCGSQGVENICTNTMCPAKPKLLKPSSIEQTLYGTKGPENYPPKKFTTCGKCDDIKECGGAGRCFGR